MKKVGVMMEEQKKICIISSSPSIGGAEIVLRDYLNESKHEFVLVVPETSEVERFFADVKSIKRKYLLPGYMQSSGNRYLSRIRNTAVFIKEAFFIMNLIRKGELNDTPIIYGNNTGSCLSLGIVEKFYKHKKKFIGHIHDMASNCSFTPIIRLLCRNMVTLTVSKKCKDELIQYAKYKPDNITVVYNGIRGGSFTKKNITEMNSPIILGFAGNIIERKGVLELVQAYRLLRDEGVDVTLKISYHSKDDEYFKKVDAILNNLPHRYENNSRDEMNQFYKSLDILLVPSRKDPLPTTVLEGMASGLIVMGSNVDGIPEMLKEEFLFNPGDENDIYKKLKWAIDNFEKLQKRCWTENPDKIKECFDSIVKTEKVDSIFDAYKD